MSTWNAAIVEGNDGYGRDDASVERLDAANCERLSVEG